MSTSPNRRIFLKSSAAAVATAGLGDLAFLSDLRPVSAGEAAQASQSVRLDSGVEPLVTLIEQTPRDRLLEEVAARIKAGASYREVLAALLLAGVKNVEPRPSVGFKFHAVLVVNSCHLASLSSPAEHRWLPIFWALDYFKSAAQRDVEERGDWVMPAVDESALPSGHAARDEFVTAMEHWDESAADAAVAQYARTGGLNEIYEDFFRLGARDFRSIGHKAIYVANSYRTLQCIGREHAEPVLRSLAYALLMHEEGNPAERDAEADRPGRRNQELVGTIRSEWRNGDLDPGGTQELLAVLRSGSNDDASDVVVELLNRGVSPQSVWDGLQVGAGELLMRQTGIIGLHAMTTTNAMHYAYMASGSDETRRMLMLQNAAFLPMFRERMHDRGAVSDVTVDDLQSESAGADPAAARERIFGEMGKSPQQAAALTLGYLQQTGQAREFIDAARVLVYLKGNDAHDYKFSSAVLEDYSHVSPEWRDLYMALSTFNLRHSGEPDSGLVDRTRAALG
ncbi:MAG: hypothetical protein DWQ29_24105 [Planctomycetota bacterium]|nr:MAG: hypothetical protein DWQ29_24105 [Planctomycetota bacterium]